MTRIIVCKLTSYKLLIRIASIQVFHFTGPSSKEFNDRSVVKIWENQKTILRCRKLRVMLVLQVWNRMLPQIL